MAMMQLDSVIHFGKWKGQTIAWVFDNDPGYLCWLRKTGFGDLGKDATLKLDAWEETYPSEAKAIDRSIARADAKKAAGGSIRGKSATYVVVDEVADLEVMRKPPEKAPASSSNPNWGSW